MRPDATGFLSANYSLTDGGLLTMKNWTKWPKIFGLVLENHVLLAYNGIFG
jgi:hypothetical protein